MKLTSHSVLIEVCRFWSEQWEGVLIVAVRVVVMMMRRMVKLNAARRPLESSLGVAVLASPQLLSPARRV